MPDRAPATPESRKRARDRAVLKAWLAAAHAMERLSPAERTRVLVSLCIAHNVTLEVFRG